MTFAGLHQLCLPEVARTARAAPSARAPRAPDLLLDGLTAHYNQGYAAGVPALRQALAVFGDGGTAEEELHWLCPACAAAAIRVWDYDRWDALSARHVQFARETGTLSELLLALTSRAYVLLFAGDLPAAVALTDEIQAVKEATGSGLAPYGAFGLAALARWSGPRPSWSRPPRQPAYPRPRPAPMTSLRRCPAPATPTGRWASGRAHALCSARARQPSACTANRSPAWPGPGSGSTSPAPICCTGNGCAASAAASTHASNCALPATCSVPWARCP